MDATTPHSLWLFFLLTFGVILLPGLDMAYVAGSALTRGLRGGLLAVAGIMAGGLVHVLVNVTGLAALMLMWPGAFNALLVAGAAYMAWIGWGIAASAFARSAAEPASSLLPAEPQRGGVFARGVLNCLLNPKAYAFMLAVFPAFLQTPERSMSQQALLLSAIIAGNQLMIYGGVALLATGAQRWAGPGAGAQRGLSLVVGATLIIAAALTLWGAWRP